MSFRKSPVYRKLIAHRAALFCLVSLGVLSLIAIFAPWVAPYSPSEVFSSSLQLPPIWSEGGSWSHPLGTDDIGRDLLSRLIHGARVSLGIGFASVVISVSIGTVFGLLSGYSGGWVDTVIMRSVDVLMSLPSMLLAIVVVTILGPNLENTVAAVAIVSLPGVIRIVRGSVLLEKTKLYVVATRSYGAGANRIALGHILPNCMAPLIVQASLGFSDAILNAAALGFLGLGAQPPTPEWGVMLADGKSYLESASWLVTLPGLCILSVVLLFNILGDGLRDALDPKL